MLERIWADRNQISSLPFLYIPSLHTRTVSEPYLLRTFFGQKYLCTEKLRTWYGASTARVRYK
ncbi:hypothetical protein [Bacteroides cellulosilyticus]|uniref:hypothetical protein n=1 Tax=Bacteroides cellulosilyticus TaxID=246787 RepID=UPI00189DF82D|nr:hypothetical protein [Bacteroides cellulosilyticus]